MPKLKFLKYQADWINNPAQFALCEKSRRIGITYAESYRVTRDLASRKVKNNKVWFSSASLSAAEEFVDYVGFWAKYLNTVAEYVGEVVIDKDDDITAHRVVFKSAGGECNVISSNPAGFRGKGGDIILDEFAHHKDQEKLFTAAKPSMMWGNRVRIISTHNGDESYFNNLCREIKKGKEGTMDNWTSFKWTIDDAIKDSLVDAILGHKASKEEIKEFLKDTFSGMTQEAIDEEFYCIPRSGADSHLLPYELIIPIERPAEKIINETLEKITGDLYIGMDIGRKKNFSIIWIVENEPAWEPITHLSIGTLKRINDEYKYAAIIIGKFFNVKTFLKVSYNNTSVIVIGTSTNIEVAKYVFYFLVNHFRRQWKQRINRRLLNKKSFYWGIYIGLCAKLHTGYKTEQQYGLIHASNQINEYFNNNFGRWKQKNKSIKPDNKATKAFHEGFIVGQSTNIRTAIDKPKKASDNMS